MFKTSIVVCALLGHISSHQLTQLQAVEAKDRIGEGSNIGIDAESFADASVQARIDTDLEIAESGSSQNQNELWKKHFQNSEFYKKYQAHLGHREEMGKIRKINNESLAQVNSEYVDLESKFKNLQASAQKNWKLGQKLAQQVPGGNGLFNQNLSQGPKEILNVLLAEDDDEEAPKRKLTPIEQSKADIESIESLEQNTKDLDKVNFDKPRAEPVIQTSVDRNAPIDPEPEAEKLKWFDQKPAMAAVVQLEEPAETRQATYRAAPWTVEVKAVRDQVTKAPAGASHVSAAPIDDSPVIEDLDPLEKAQNPHDHIYDNFPKGKLCPGGCDQQATATAPEAPSASAQLSEGTSFEERPQGRKLIRNDSLNGVLKELNDEDTSSTEKKIIALEQQYAVKSCDK